ncbi:Leucine-rich repeat protein kinase family protein [Euphorbia peplus]|nr:Leucine-rich repeat protein kinase family protein [Euphorbia peplus]
MSPSTSFSILFLTWVLFNIFPTHELQTNQAQLLLQLRKHLEYPSQLDIWGTYPTDFCNLSSTLHVTIICKDNAISELKIRGDKLPKVSTSTDFHGYPIANQTLSSTFSIDSFFTTLTRLTTLRSVSLVSLGIWGTLPDKIHRLSSIEYLDLSSNFIFGSVPPQLSRMVKLKSLILDENFFNGSLPDWFDSFSELTILSLKYNRFKGSFPSSICRIPTLTDLALCHNELTGELPDLGSLSNLLLLDLRENSLGSRLPAMPKELITLLLGNNTFSGDIPEQFGSLSRLQHLDLSLNRLGGKPPSSLFSLPNIRYLNLAYNELAGSLPKDLKCGPNLGFVDISENKLFGRLPSCLDSRRAVKIGGNCFSVNGQNQHQNGYCEAINMEVKQSRGRATGTLVAVISASIVVLMLLALGVLFLCSRYRSRKTSEQNIVSKAVQDNNTSTAVSADVLANARFISQTARFCSQGSPAYHAFSFEELTEATNNFHSSTFMGEGSNGKIYRGRLGNGTMIAIRSLDLPKKNSIQNIKVRLDLLSKLHHPHLVGFLGYCIHNNGQDDLGGTKIFLIYEYVPNGNYRAHLSETCPDKVLNWTDRLAILIGAAKAVHFLHTGVFPGTFNNRLKTNNILLDEHKISKLSDYGIAVITQDIEKLEVKAETQKSRHRTNMEDDVYNFGFILLESLVGPIVTGKGEAFLLNEMASFGSQDGRRRIVDPAVLTTCAQESLSIVVSITSKCISPEPSGRPPFEDVLWNLQYAAQIQASADFDQKSESASQS